MAERPSDSDLVADWPLAKLPIISNPMVDQPSGEADLVVGRNDPATVDVFKATHSGASSHGISQDRSPDEEAIADDIGGVCSSTAKEELDRTQSYPIGESTIRGDINCSVLTLGVPSPLLASGN